MKMMALAAGILFADVRRGSSRRNNAQLIEIEMIALGQCTSA